ncbi:glycosyltransferase involved in cell wall biosynthesis [Motilibacter rhizosphaerae]|uniref:Glycosyltransferase involved in cell wall biosynthesis n=1 Tax=Motilibacter rhizosphaerae TaxID=598652 RepID=A0A4Q7NY25_9ACTN|nr:glycosyltransferase family 4 protein [Motilibacter rhizosphaerae]RZS91292.1 glycosyltransferase involved in cell wall biosynthesis [Motilibacter rhizosphaerae]
MTRRVLVLHNAYRSELPSGENAVVEQEVAGLRAAGAEVTLVLRRSDDIAAMGVQDKLRTAVAPVAAPGTVREVVALARERGCEVAHLHNPYPMLSLGVVRGLHEAGIPVVHTVHNHRHTCMKGTYRRDGHDCRDCAAARLPWPGVAHRCYRGSAAQSLVMATALTRYPYARQPIARHLALTPEIRESLLGAGVPEERIVLKPNGVPDPGPATPPGRGFLFVGRVSEEKGVLLLADAWLRHPDGALGTLTVVGDGPELPVLRQRVAQRRDVELTGQLDRPAVAERMRAAAYVVVPSVWPEAQPLVVLETLAHGRPLLVSAVGGLPALVPPGGGTVVAPDAGAWAAALAEASVADLAQQGAAARAAYERQHSSEVSVRRLLAVYEEVLAGRW